MRPRRVRVALAAAVVVVVAMAGPWGAPAEAAPAAPGYDRCPQGRFCLFDGVEGEGAMYVATGTRYDQVLAEAGFDNRAGSLANNSYLVWCVYEGANHTGKGVGFGTGRQTNLEEHTLKDQVSSVRYGQLGC